MYVYSRRGVLTHTSSHTPHITRCENTYVSTSYVISSTLVVSEVCSNITPMLLNTAVVFCTARFIITVYDHVNYKHMFHNFSQLKLPTFIVKSDINYTELIL